MRTISNNERAVVANVSLLTDLLLANLPAGGLRSVLRTLVSSHPDITNDLTRWSSGYLQRQYTQIEQTIKNGFTCIEDLRRVQGIIAAFVGCRLCMQSLALFSQTLRACAPVFKDSFGDDGMIFLVSVDGDIAQALSLLSVSEVKEEQIFALKDLSASMDSLALHYRFERSRATLRLHRIESDIDDAVTIEKIANTRFPIEGVEIETFRIGDRPVPRIFCGLWQLCSSAWGSSSLSQIMDGFEHHLRKGFTAFDMADIYGDVEVVFGEFRSRLENPELVFAATKYCTFDTRAQIPEQVQDYVSERLRRLRSDSIDLLQLHWADYSDARYLEALKALQDDSRVKHLGLCNFDTENMENVLRRGIDIRTNQVQFSLVDSRATVKVAALCEKHGVKLLTYGTLCGGFISERWLGRPEPDTFSDEITPSQRKYLEMIASWGGWSLFQSLLSTLSTIATKHNASVSNVATRWVLDFPCVGAVIIGSRMGISERMDDNLAVYGWHLDGEDQASIERILTRSRRMEMFREIGDCGGEHR